MEIKKINKRGMFFTLVAIALLSLFLLSYSVYSISEGRDKINKRISSMNDFVFSVEKDLQRKLFISGFRIIFIYEGRILETENYISDVDATFSEAFFNGTINNQISSDEEILMNGVRFQDIEASLKEDAQGLNLNLSLLSPEISISQEDPWRVKVSLKTDLIIQDRGNLASWNRTAVIESYIPIENFEDPLYIVNTKGKIPMKINKTIYTTFVNGGDVSNLLDHLGKRYYVNSTLAPSFLNRLEGNLSANENGIESFVYLPNLASQGFSIKDKSVVDYIYFSDNNPGKDTVAGMPAWFKIDDAHKAAYGIV
jgi:hypothetical protein